MPKFIVCETLPCFVHFYREVEAASQEDALKQDEIEGGKLLGYVIDETLAYASPPPCLVDALPSENFLAEEQAAPTPVVPIVPEWPCWYIKHNDKVVVRNSGQIIYTGKYDDMTPELKAFVTDFSLDFSDVAHILLDVTELTKEPNNVVDESQRPAGS